jgi:hypothetical protein
MVDGVGFYEFWFLGLVEILMKDLHLRIRSMEICFWSMEIFS